MSLIPSAPFSSTNAFPHVWRVHSRPFCYHCPEKWLEQDQKRRVASAGPTEFDAFVTVDRKLATQQDLTKFRIQVLLIRARTNRLEHIRPLAAELLEKLPEAARGALTVIGT